MGSADPRTGRMGDSSAGRLPAGTRRRRRRRRRTPADARARALLGCVASRGGAPGRRRGRGREGGMRDVQVRRGSYVDSVALMQVSRRVSSLDGVASALVAMATDLNLELLETMGFEVPGASANEMLVAIDAATDEVLHTARVEVDAA